MKTFNILNEHCYIVLSKNDIKNMLEYIGKGKGTKIKVFYLELSEVIVNGKKQNIQAEIDYCKIGNCFRLPPLQSYYNY